MSELVTTESETTIGIFENRDDGADIYVPLICWNLSIERYVSDPESSFRAYGCNVKIESRDQSKVKNFKVFIKENDFYKFDKVRASIVAQTHGKEYKT